MTVLITSKYTAHCDLERAGVSRAENCIGKLQRDGRRAVEVWGDGCRGAVDDELRFEGRAVRVYRRAAKGDVASRLCRACEVLPEEQGGARVPVRAGVPGLDDCIEARTQVGRLSEKTAPTTKGLVDLHGDGVLTSCSGSGGCVDRLVHRAASGEPVRQLVSRKARSGSEGR